MNDGPSSASASAPASAPAGDRARRAPVRLGPPRSAWMQIRVAPAEKVAMAERARAAGFESVSAFIRSFALGGQKHA